MTERKDDRLWGGRFENGPDARFDAFHINAHIAADAKTIFNTATSNMGGIRAGDHCFCRNASCIYTGAAKLVTFDDGDGLACC